MSTLARHRHMPALLNHLGLCAQLHACTTPALASRALNCSREDAATALRDAVAAGFVRRFLLPGLGQTPLYQPTARAYGNTVRKAPKFFRAGTSDAARWRGILRGAVAFAHPHNGALLTPNEIADLCEQYSVPTAGHALPIITLEEAGGYSVIVPVPPHEAERGAHGVVVSAAERWIALLEREHACVSFATMAGAAASSMRAVLAELAPTESHARADLAELDARIEADKTGLAGIQLARQRAELVAAAEAARDATFPWLVREVVEVQL